MFNSCKAGSALALSAGVGLALLTVSAHAQALDQYSFIGQGNTAGPVAPESYDPNVSAGSIDKAPGSSYFNYSPGFRSDAYDVYSTSDLADLQAAIDNNAFFTFTVTPNAGFSMTVTGFSGDIVTQNIGQSDGQGGLVHRNFYLLSSVGGFSTNAVLAEFVNPGAATGSQTNNAVSASLTGLNNLTAPVEFRVYIDGTGGYQNKGFDTADGVVLSGTTAPTPAPEPSQRAALGLGVLGLAGLALKARQRRDAA